MGVLEPIEANIHTHIHTYGQFLSDQLTELHVFG